MMKYVVCVSFSDSYNAIKSFTDSRYVPALRQLRQNSMILNFPQTESTKLASRLYEVKCFPFVIKAPQITLW